MLINVQNKHNEITDCIINNQKDIFTLYNYYTKKWRGNRLNDVSIGLFIADGNIPTVQVFVRNKTGYIRSRIGFNKAGNTIINNNILNYKIND